MGRSNIADASTSFRVTEEVRALHKESLVLDWQCDSLLERELFGYDFLRSHKPLPFLSPIGRHVDLPRALGNVSCFGLGAVPPPILRDAWKHVVRQCEGFRSWQARDERVVFADTAADIRAAHAKGKLACFIGIEGAHGLNGDLGKVAAFEELGVRYVTLNHFNSNKASPAAQGWRASNEAPLRPWGYELIDALIDHKIMVDLAHVGRRSFLDAAEHCRHRGVPVIVSHTACDAVCRINRNITDEQLRAVADTGGVAAIIFAPMFLSKKRRDHVSCLLPHLRHVRQTIGVDHLALGSDFDGWILSLPVGLQDVTDMPAITQLMMDDGWTHEEILSVLGESSLRVISMVRPDTDGGSSAPLAENEEEAGKQQEPQGSTAG